MRVQLKVLDNQLDSDVSQLPKRGKTMLFGKSKLINQQDTNIPNKPVEDIEQGETIKCKIPYGQAIYNLMCQIETISLLDDEEEDTVQMRESSKRKAINVFCDRYDCKFGH